MTLAVESNFLIDIFGVDNVSRVFEEVSSQKNTKGIDREDIEQFKSKQKEHCRVIHTKCLNGTYKFSPYLQKLIPKGKNKYPRIISIPTLRDKVVLILMKDILHSVFSDRIQRKVPNIYIKDIKDFLQESDSKICWFKTDIKNYFDNIVHERLLKKIETRLKQDYFQVLLVSLLKNSTVSLRCRKEDKIVNKKGVPQGLPISNILASIYAEDIDQSIARIGLKSFRYVDDILIFTKKRKKIETTNNIQKLLKSLGLKWNKEKTYYYHISKEFTYLGYRIHFKKHKGISVSVRSSSVEKLILSVKGMFKSYAARNHEKLRKFPNIPIPELEEVFISDLNEKITGAISEKKRYGWLFFFLEINDISLLYKLDSIVKKFFKESKEFGHLLSKRKRFVKAYYSAKFDRDRKYIHNYDKIKTYADKIKYIRLRADIDPEGAQTYSEEEIDNLFNMIRYRNLSRLEKDIGILS